MAKENPNVEANKEAANAEAPAPETVPKEQYDALLRQAQALVNDANAKISALEADNKLLKDTLAAQNKLILAANNTPEAK